MSKNRLEAFSDGVLAIVITIMVLELKVPHEATWEALSKLAPVFSSYLLSFVYIGIYWNNHHHMLHAAQRIDGAVLWANQHLLFWLSLVPFATAWMGENHFAALPVTVYGIALLMPAIAYTVLARTLVAVHGRESPFARALGRDAKGLISLAIYAAALACAPRWPAAALGAYVLVAVMWLVPDQRFRSAHPG